MTYSNIPRETWTVSAACEIPEPERKVFGLKTGSAGTGWRSLCSGCLAASCPAAPARWPDTWRWNTCYRPVPDTPVTRKLVMRPCWYTFTLREFLVVLKCPDMSLTKLCIRSIASLVTRNTETWKIRWASTLTVYIYIQVSHRFFV